MRVRVVVLIVVLFLLSSCKSMERGCAAGCANNLGADWVVVELVEATGTPYRCWMLKGVSISNESASDGIYWQSPEGHLVHISGSYDRVQVHRNRWSEALAEVNLTEEGCKAIQKRVFNPKTNRYE